MLQAQFGSGVSYLVPVAGNMAANPTPFKLGVQQDAQVDFKAETKELLGQKQFPVAIGRASMKVTVKSKFAVLDPNMFNQIYFGQASAAGINLIADDEAGVIGAAAPPAWQAAHGYALGALVTDGTNVQKCITAGNSEGAPGPPAWSVIIGGDTADGAVVWQNMGPVANSIVVANATNFVTDYGVRNAATGAQLLTGTPGALTTGQYSVASGHYSFAAADAGNGVLISYSYTAATRGTTITLANQLQGFSPQFKSFLYNVTNGKFWGLELNACQATDLSVPTKHGDFWIADIGYSAFTDAADVLGHIYADN